jgi:mannosyltransferase
MCKKKKIKIVLIVIVFLGLALRLFCLDRDLWYDEVDSLWRAQNLEQYHEQSLGNTNTPPLYITVLSYWIKLFGTEEFFIRLPSVLSSTFVIPLVFYIALFLFPPGIALLSSFLCAVSPFQIWFAQEARAYSLSLLLVSLMTILGLRACRNGTWKNCILFIASFVLAFYSSYYAALVFILIYVLVLTKNAKRVLWVSALFLVLLMPLFTIFVKDIQSVQAGFWVPKPTLIDSVACIQNLVLGYNATLFEYQTISLFIAALIINCCLNSSKQVGAHEEKRLFSAEKRAFFIALLFVFPLLSAFLISRFVPIFLTRQFIVVTPFLYILISVGIFRISCKKIRYACIVFLTMLMSISLWRHYTLSMPSPHWHRPGVHLKKTHGPIVDKIKSEMGSEDIFAYSDVSYGGPLVLYYLDDFDIPFVYLRIPEEETLYVRKNLSHIPMLEWSPKRDSRPHPSLAVWNNRSVIRLFNEQKFKAKSRLWLLSSNWSRDGNILRHSQAVLDRARQFYLHLERFEAEGIYIDIFSLDEDDFLKNTIK